MDHVYYLRSLNSPATFRFAASPPAQGGGGGAGALADWQSRIGGADVEFFSDFSGANDFVLASTNGGHVFAPGMDPAVLALVTKDLTDGLTNGCCLRISTPAATSQNGASWMFPFAFDYVSNASNIGNDIWIQFRFKIPTSRLVLSNCGGNQRGWKWANFAQYSVVDTDSQSFSNTNCEHVLQDTDQRGLPQSYHQTGSNFEPFNGFAGGQITLQTAIDRGAPLTGGDRFCHYPNGTPACEFFPVDEWMTFMLRMQLASFSQGPGNIFDLWMARAGATVWTHVMHDADYLLGSPNSSGGGFTTINGGHLLTYETNRVNSTVPTYHQYDQVIVSRSEIPIPLDSGVGVGSTALALAAAAMTSGTWAQMSPAPSGLSLFTGQAGVSGLAIAFAIKMARDRGAGKLYFIGSDHITPTIFLGYNEATNIWSAEAASVPWGGGTNGNTTPSHGYDHTVFDPVGNKLYHRPFGTRALRRWDGGTTWGTLSYSGVLGYTAGSAGVAWFPELGAAGRIVVHQLENGVNGALISIDPDGTITTHVDGSSSTLAGTGDPHCFCMYSPQRGCVVFGGGNSSSKVWKMSAAGTITALNDIPGAITETVGPGSPNAIPFVHPVNGNLVVIQSSNNWVELNPNAASGSQWTTKVGTVSMLSNNTVNSSAYGVVAATLPEYGVTVFMKNYSASQPAEMWLWKP